MTSSLSNSFIGENLKFLCCFNEQTRLAIYEPAHKLYIVKCAPLSSLDVYQDLAAIDNPHLAKIIGISVKPDHLEVIREYISGDTLADRLRSHHIMPADQAVSIVVDVCDGLASMHKAGYVHRDINPNNIIVTAQNSAVIIDFGIARSFSQNKASDTVILGTPGYAAPEQFGFSQSDWRTDIYAVGVLLNVMLTGQMPNQAKAEKPYGRIVSRCVAVDSKKRYKNVADLRQAVTVLSNIASGRPLDNVISQIPGLRSPYPVVIILSIVGYIAVLILTIATFATVKNNAYLLTAVSWLFSVLIPYFCFNNFLKIWDRLPFSAGSSIKSQRISYTLLGIGSLLIGLLIFGSIN